MIVKTTIKMKMKEKVNRQTYKRKGKVDITNRVEPNPLEMRTLNLTGRDYQRLLPGPPRLSLNMGDLQLSDAVGKRSLPIYEEDY